MEVSRFNFAPRVLDMLEDMAKCCFVAIDFEFSGIATKSVHAAGKQTLQERYSETKEAAERYQILQIGLTFAIYDDERHRYILKPYNMNLNPLINEKLDIERIFSFQSGAVEFLLRHGFNLQEPFTSGLPYLSRDEAAMAKKIAYDRLTRKNIQDVVIGDEDVEAQAFMQGLRKVIDVWQREGYEELEISSRQDVCEPSNNETQGTDSPPTSHSGLTRFEKRLVHQLVRGTYPNLLTISGRDSIRIIHLDEEREAEFLYKRKRAVKEQIARQTGFRWIVEALLGNPLERINVRSFAFDPDTGMDRFVDLHALKSRFDQACASIKRKRIPLVGHNMFTDLVYFYRTFIGVLPEGVEAFTAQTHELFPTIVDTKYLATHNCGDINPASSLQEIEDRLQIQERPVTETHPNHVKYAAREALHEAGYDSYLTALVAIRLSAKLEHEGAYRRELEATAGGSTQLEGEAGSVLKNVMRAGVSLLAPSSTTKTADGDVSRSTTAYNAPETSIASRFSSSNVFEKLGMLSLSNDSRFDQGEVWNTTVDASQETQEPLPAMTEMPRFGSDFWAVYGNKLRMFGTVDGLLDLSPPT